MAKSFQRFLIGIGLYLPLAAIAFLVVAVDFWRWSLREIADFIFDGRAFCPKEE